MAVKKQKTKKSGGAKKLKTRSGSGKKAGATKKNTTKSLKNKNAVDKKISRKKAHKKVAKKKQDSKKAGSQNKSSSPRSSRKVRKPRGLSKKDILYFKEKLLGEKQRVLEEMGEMQTNNLKQSVTDKTGEISRYSYHLGDTASISYEHEFSMGLAERQQKYLEQIDDAMSRIEEGVYGICKVTGEPIPRERLEEVPVAKYSVKGKEILQRQKRMGAG